VTLKGFHERLARVALGTVEEFGFVLAGGYALVMNGFGDRPSMDVDLFTNDMSLEHFDQAVDNAIHALEKEGFEVVVLVRSGLFANLEVRDVINAEQSEIQFGWDYREFPPAHVSIGPVLDSRDAVANKMTALYSRGEVRDFIDIHTVLSSGSYSREEILALADEREANPLDRDLLIQRFLMVTYYDSTTFGQYGVASATTEEIINTFIQWARDLSH
jgi:nucleotide-binding universal stress UspA family protein